MYCLELFVASGLWNYFSALLHFSVSSENKNLMYNLLHELSIFKQCQAFVFKRAEIYEIWNTREHIGTFKISVSAH